MTQLAHILAVPAIVLILGYLPIGRRRLAAFATSHDLTVTVPNGSLLIAYLARSARWRSTGAALGWVSGATFVLHGNAFFWGAAGYLLGALGAEFRTSVRLPPGPRRAELVQRRSKDYLSRAARWGPVIVLAIAAFEFWMPFRYPPEQDGWLTAAVLSVVTTAGAAALLWAGRWLIVRRPRPVVSPDVDRADEVIRMSSLQIIGGSALALMCLATSGMAFGYALEVPGLLGTVQTGLPYLMLLCALYAWFRVRVSR